MKKYLFELALCLLVLFAYGMFKMALGRFVFTWDERADTEIVRCIYDTLSLSQCDGDPTQFRFPHVLHASLLFLARATGIYVPVSGANSQNFHGHISFFLVIASLCLVYRLTTSYFGKPTALIAVTMISFCSAILTSLSLVLTHSMSVTVFMVMLTVYSATRLMERPSFASVALFCISLFFLSWSSPLAIPYGLALAGVLTLRLLGNGRSIEASTIVAFICFVVLSLLFSQRAVDYAQDFQDASPLMGWFNYWWNPLNSQEAIAPWHFGITIWLIKFSPWWAIVVLAATFDLYRRKRLNALHECLIINNLLLLLTVVFKSVLFKFDGPHQQVIYYPLAYISVAQFLHRTWATSFGIAKTSIAGLLFVGILLQWVECISIAPYYWFSGAQYGSSYIGEFYGPAVLDERHRDRSAIAERALRSLKSRGAEVSRLTRDQFEVTSDFVFESALLTKYVKMPQLRYLKAEISKQCKEIASDTFPFGYDAYILYDCRKATLAIDPDQYYEWTKNQANLKQD